MMPVGNKKARSLWRRLRDPSVARVEVFLFLFLWLGYGAAINSANLIKFNLQQIGVEAIVERHQFYLEGSEVPELFPRGDVFLYHGHKYAAKQPGQVILGASVYQVLRWFGLSYKSNYLLTSALVTFFTSSLVLAASAVAVFKSARRLAKVSQSFFWPGLTTFAYALATTIFAYSGIAHHDTLATGLLVIAFYLILDLPRKGWDGRREMVRSAAAGLLLGLAVTTSMLVFFMTIVCALWFLWLRRWKLVPFLLAGIVIGLLPLFVYDARSFGNPFLLANVAGAQVFADTFFHFSAPNLGDKLVWYATMLSVYAPIFLVGLFGLSYYPRAALRPPAFVAMTAMLVVLAAYVLNIQTGGDCQFGPRYLLPAMPFACLGIAGYSYLSTKTERRLAVVLVLLVGGFSFAVNLLGALQGAMNCPDGGHALRDQFTRLTRGEVNSFPLAAWLLAPLLICFGWFAWTAWTWPKARDHFTR